MLAAAEAKRKLKIKYEDREEEVDEEEVLKVYKSRKSHQQAANKELQEGKAARKQTDRARGPSGSTSGHTSTTGYLRWSGLTETIANLA